MTTKKGKQLKYNQKFNSLANFSANCIFLQVERNRANCLQNHSYEYSECIFSSLPKPFLRTEWIFVQIIHKY